VSRVKLPDTPVEPAVIDSPEFTVNVAEQPVVVRLVEVAPATVPLTVRLPLLEELVNEKLLPVELPSMIAAALSDTVTLPVVFAVTFAAVTGRC